MDNTIIVALITGVCAIIGQLIISAQSTKRKKMDDAVRDARLDDRLSGVERRLDEHNGYAKRFAEISTDIAVIKNDIKTLYKER